VAKGQSDKGKEVRTFRDLVVWQKSMTLVTTIYRLTRLFPADEAYGLTSQTRRSAVSIASNIAEGYGRRSTSDYVRFLCIATGSLYELQTQIEIALNLRYLKRAEFVELYESSREIERMLSSLVRKLSGKRME
jgi:four helix bundle protein